MSRPLHANMRTFLPLTGEILYGATRFDLLAYEEALLELLRAVPAARTAIDGDRSNSNQLSFGFSQPRLIDAEYIQRRRSALANMRNAGATPGLRAARVDDPRTVVMVITPPHDASAGSTPAA